MDSGGGPETSAVPVTCCCSTGLATSATTCDVSVVTGGVSLAAGVASTLSDDVITWSLKQLQFHLPYNRSYW